MLPLMMTGAQTKMAQPSTRRFRPLCLDLPTERDAMKVAQRIADRMAVTSHSQPGMVITVTDETGNVVCKVPVPAKN